MTTPYIDSRNIGDFLLFIKNPTPGYLYGIKYIDIISDEYIYNKEDSTSSHNIKYIDIKCYKYIWSFVEELSGVLSNLAIHIHKSEILKRFTVSDILIHVHKIKLIRRIIL